MRNLIPSVSGISCPVAPLEILSANGHSLPMLVSRQYVPSVVLTLSLLVLGFHQYETLVPYQRHESADMVPPDGPEGWSKAHLQEVRGQQGSGPECRATRCTMYSMIVCPAHGRGGRRRLTARTHSRHWLSRGVLLLHRPLLTFAAVAFEMLNVSAHKATQTSAR